MTSTIAGKRWSFSVSFAITWNIFPPSERVGDRVASSKMVQYRTALACGFIVPDTVYANSKPAVEALAGRHQTLCLKAIEGTDIWDDEQGVDYVFYTQTLQSADVATIPEEAFRQTVNFVQEYVPKQYELRITVVGEEVFAAKSFRRNSLTIRAESTGAKVMTAGSAFPSAPCRRIFGKSVSCWFTPSA